MPKFYCLNCGFGTDYTLHKPKVCLKCNYSFVQSSVASKPNIVSFSPPVIHHNKPIERPIIINSDEFEEDVSDYITDLPREQKLSFANVEAERNCSSISGGQIIQKAKEKNQTQAKPKRGRAKRS